MEKKIKLLMIGNTGVGKTALLSRYTSNKFNEAYISTIGIDYQEKLVTLQGRNYSLQVWDTAGQ